MLSMILHSFWVSLIYWWFSITLFLVLYLLFVSIDKWSCSSVYSESSLLLWFVLLLWIILSFKLLFWAEDGRLTLIVVLYLSFSSSRLDLAYINSESRAVWGRGGLFVFASLFLFSLIKFFCSFSTYFQLILS